MSDGTPIIIKKKKAHGHGHHGGSWKVAYADFVTAMMAFFMVMWIMGLSDQTRAQIQGYFNDPAGFMKNPPRSKNIMVAGMPASKKAASKENGEDVQGKQEAARQLERKLKGELSAEGKAGDNEVKALLQGVEITITDEGVQIEFIEKHRTFFEIGSAVIRPEARQVVATIGKVLAATKRTMMIDGHTDSRPLNNPAYNNWDLSTDRAAAVRRLFQTTGVSDKQFLQVRGNADRKLRIPSDPYNSENRRVTIMLPFKVYGLPADLVTNKTGENFPPEVDLRPPAPKISGN
ncbi:MAG: flagellar motor protein MotB [Fimbriimonadaceae bacterium]|nr:flagellar motor protein MotB [Fimbriimonadaceae bacterium]